MNNLILNKDILNFNDVEKAVFTFVCGIGTEILKTILEKIDDELHENRNKKEYRYKFKKEKTIQTVMGDLKYERRYYINRYTNQGTFLLDEAVKLNLIGRTSPNLIFKAVDNALKSSYRESSLDISKTTNTDVSHQTIKNKVDYIGNKIKSLENHRMAKYLRNELKGDKKIRVLFEEKDGVFLKIQGKKNKQEMKLAKIYEGWKNSNGTFSTVGTMYFAGYDDRETFDNLVNSGIAESYDYENIEYIILNGDGASWISAEVEDNANMIYQLDLFHIHQKATRKIKAEELRQEAKKLINKSKYKELLKRIKEAIEKETDEKIKEYLIDAQKYYENNFEALTRYKDRKDVNLPDPPEGIEYRGLGTMESSIHNVLAGRMKNNGTSWSVDGANNIAKLLAIKHSKILDTKLDEIIENQESIDFIDIGKIIKAQFDEAKKDVNREVKAAIKDQKAKRKYSCTKSTIVHGEGKATAISKVLKDLIYGKWLKNII